MRLRDGRGRTVTIGARTIGQLPEAQSGSGYKESWMAPEKLSLKRLRSEYLCRNASCVECEVMCGYGRRYLELTGGDGA